MFGSHQQLTKINPEPLHASPDLTELSNKVKYLGGFLDNTLSFDLHVSSKVQKAMANFIKIKSICKYITQETCTTLLLMLCMSHLDYLNAVLYGISNKTLNKYQRIQNMCAKLALDKSKYDSSTESLKTLHWLPIQKQIRVQNSCIDSQVHQQFCTKIPARMYFSQGTKKGKHEIQQHGSLTQYTHSQTNNICSQILQTCCTNTVEQITKHQMHQQPRQVQRITKNKPVSSSILLNTPKPKLLGAIMSVKCM